MINKDHLLVRRMMMGYSQEELAEIVGMHHTTISAYETGRHRPCPDRIVRLCKALKTEPNKVLKGWDE